MKKTVSIILLLLCTAIASFAQAGQTKRMAVTALSENMMRAEPDYESALETQSLMGTIVEIVAEELDRHLLPDSHAGWHKAGFLGRRRI